MPAMRLEAMTAMMKRRLALLVTFPTGVAEFMLLAMLDVAPLAQLWCVVQLCRTCRT